jgi:hypothetical protein
MNMMGSLGISMKVKCKKDVILAKLKANLETHAKLVVEAREGYTKKAREELKKLLGKVDEGKINNLTFTLRAPKDYSSVYKTTISMLEDHVGTEIELEASEYRMLVEDEWDWVRDFAVGNSAYSTGTRAYAMSKGLDLE